MWKLHRRLRIDEGVSENGFFCLKLCRHVDAWSPLAIWTSERVLVECEREGTNAIGSESILIILQLLYEGGFNLKVWPSRVQELKRLYH